jgi:hypothetical protein
MGKYAKACAAVRGVLSRKSWERLAILNRRIARDRAELEVISAPLSQVYWETWRALPTKAMRDGFSREYLGLSPQKAKR